MEVEQEVTHRVVARRRKKCVIDIEAEGCPPEIAKVAAWSLLTLEWLGSARVAYPCVVDHASEVIELMGLNIGGRRERWVYEAPCETLLDIKVLHGSGLRK